MTVLGLGFQENVVAGMHALPQLLDTQQTSIRFLEEFPARGCHGIPAIRFLALAPEIAPTRVAYVLTDKEQ
jgi:hypothetical protein